MDDLLHRATSGPDRRVAARTRAAAAMPMRPPVPRPGPDDNVDEPDSDGQLATVIPFGVFDAFTDGTR